MHTRDGSNPHGGTPDLLITNYSMLEYMLLRPIEQPLFEDTREWLAEDEENELNIVLDEAHLYRGAQGAEVALLLSRLLQKTRDIPRTCALHPHECDDGRKRRGSSPRICGPAHNRRSDDFSVITGEQVEYEGGEPSEKRTAQLLERVGYQLDDPSKIRNVASERGWDPLESDDVESVRSYLADQLVDDPLFRLAHEYLREEPLRLSALAEVLFEDIDQELAREATGNLLYLCTEARQERTRRCFRRAYICSSKGSPPSMRVSILNAAAAG